MTHASQRKKSALMTTDRAGNTPLIKAVIFGCTAKVRKNSARNGAVLNAQGWAGNTALHVAVQLRNLGMIRALLASPAIDTGITNDAGHTALALAQEHHDRDVERVFRNAAAQAQRRSAHGKTGGKAIVRTRRAPYCATVRAMPTP